MLRKFVADYNSHFTFCFCVFLKRIFKGQQTNRIMFGLGQWEKYAFSYHLNSSGNFAKYNFVWQKNLKSTID